LHKITNDGGLSFENYRLTEIPAVFDEFKFANVLKINLSWNSIDDLSAQLFTSLLNLKEIDLSYNLLTEIPCEIKSCL